MSNRRFSRTTCLRVCAAALVVGCGISALGVRADNKEWIQLDLVVNIYKGSTATKDNVKELVKKVNEIYKQACVRFVLADKNIRTDLAAPGGGAASSLSRDDRDRVRKDGGKELVDGKGLKFSFVSQVNKDNAGVNGVAIGGDPTCICKFRPGALGAITAAHEAGHILGLVHVDDRANLMYETDDNSDTKLTDAQKKTVMEDAKKRGKTVEQCDKPMVGPPMNSLKSRHGLGSRPNSSDTFVNTPNAFRNPIHTTMFSNEGSGVLDVSVQLGGLVPAGVTDRHFLAWDTDNNLGTGRPVNGMPGYDKVIEIVASDTGADLLLHEFGSFPDRVMPLGMAMVANNIASQDFGPEDPLEGQSSVAFSLPLSLLGLGSANRNDVLVLNGSLDAPTTFYEVDYFQDYSLVTPTVITESIFVGPGESMLLNGSGFSPNTLVDLLADDLMMLQVMTDGSGAFSTSAALPADFAGDDAFISAVEQTTGVSSFTIVAVPEPAGLAVVGLVGVAGLIRRRA